MSRTDWQTPKEFYDKLNAAAGGFAVDAAAAATNHLVGVWYGPGSVVSEDALSVEQWLNPAFCNPPYLNGKEWKRWLAKFLEQAAKGVTVCAVMPASTGVEWWYEYIIKPGANVFLVNPRLEFVIPNEEHHNPNHNSAVVCYGPDMARQVAWLRWKDA